MTWLEQRLSHLATVNSFGNLKKHLEETRRHYSLANIAFHATNIPNVVARHPLIIVTYEPNWVKRYLECNYFEIDPVVLEGSRGFLPLDWKRIDRSNERMRKLFAEAESYGVGRRGLTLSIRGPNGEKSLVTITSYEEDDHWVRRRTRLIRDFQTLAHYIHDRAMVLAGNRPDVERTKLSRRELQCLELLARGRAPKVIAYELDISLSAVRLYIASARRKLGASSTNQAVALGTRDGFIGI